MKAKREVGRPSKYKQEFCDQAYKYCLLGATDKDLSEFFDVAEDTIHEWKKVYPEFSESIKDGKQIADIKVVESLYKRATGYQQQEVKIFQYEGMPVVVPFTAIIAPETTAAIFWLKNRQPKVWRDKQEIQHTLPEKQIIKIGDQTIEF